MLPLEIAQTHICLHLKHLLGHTVLVRQEIFQQDTTRIGQRCQWWWHPKSCTTVSVLGMRKSKLTAHQRETKNITLLILLILHSKYGSAIRGIGLGLSL